MSEKILVINEPFVKDFCRTQRWAARTRARVLRAPDWLAYATAVLEKEGFDVELHDFPARNMEKEDLRVLAQRKKPALAILDCVTPSVYSDIDCARIIKEEAPECRIIMVGPHASTQADELLRDADGAVDAVARGEYEYTIRDYARYILKSSMQLDQILGITYLDHGTIRRNPDRPPIENLDELPFPAWHHLDVLSYFDGVKLFPYVDIIGGRGCPFQCMFCLWPQVMHGNRYRLRSASNIADEIQWVLEKWPGIREGEFFFEDDTFTVNAARAHQICDEILRRRITCTWSVNSRADVLDQDLFRHMKEAGCRLVLTGFESGSDMMLERMNKRVNVDTMKKFIRIVKKAGLDIHGCFVLGLPGETEGTMKETLDFALHNDLDTVQFSGAVPFPGTKYFSYCRENNLLRAKRWDEWLSDGEQTPVVDYPGLSRTLVEKYVDMGLKKFYFRPSYMMKFLLKTRSKSDLYRKLRGAKNFISYVFSKF